MTIVKVRYPNGKEYAIQLPPEDDGQSPQGRPHYIGQWERDKKAAHIEEVSKNAGTDASTIVMQGLKSQINNLQALLDEAREDLKLSHKRISDQHEERDRLKLLIQGYDKELRALKDDHFNDTQQIAATNKILKENSILENQIKAAQRVVVDLSLVADHVLSLSTRADKRSAHMLTIDKQSVPHNWIRTTADALTAAVNFLEPVYGKDFVKTFELELADRRAAMPKPKLARKAKSNASPRTRKRRRPLSGRKRKS